VRLERNAADQADWIKYRFLCHFRLHTCATFNDISLSTFIHCKNR